MRQVGLQLLAERPIRQQVARVYIDRCGHLRVLLGSSDITDLVRAYASQPAELLDWAEQFHREGLI